MAVAVVTTKPPLLIEENMIQKRIASVYDRFDVQISFECLSRVADLRTCGRACILVFCDHNDENEVIEKVD